MASAAEGAASPAASRVADESDLDPAAFLQSVRELSEKRDREDNERYRKLEEEIEKGRQERAQRRAERARSISPEKAIQPNAHQPPTNETENPTVSTVISPPPLAPYPAREPAIMDVDVSNRDTNVAEEVPDFQGFGSSSKPRTLPSSTTTVTEPPARSSSPTKQPSAASLARSGTLSWQQRRPGSIAARSRPQSVAVADDNYQATSGAQQEDERLSRDQIAASLGSRDPTWFRQTADRGLGSAAFRKSNEEAVSDENMQSERRGLPGMSRESSIKVAADNGSLALYNMASEESSRSDIVKGGDSPNTAGPSSRVSSGSKPDLRSLIAADEMQEQASPMAQRTTSLETGTSGDLGRSGSTVGLEAREGSAIGRPSSPTKGMGGFVQSAMMKRNDSVSKRWSAQPGTSLGRYNSVSSLRNNQSGLTGSHSMPKLDPTSSSKESSAEPVSRPNSSSNKAEEISVGRSDGDTIIRAAAHHVRSKSVVSNYNIAAEERPGTPPASPGKRWSPTKSSWLESAISRPESPKPSLARNSQPSWMTDIAKAKAQRGSGDSIAKSLQNDDKTPQSPTKSAFGQSMLRRAESRDLDAGLKPSAPATDSTGKNKVEKVILSKPKEVSSALSMAAPSQSPQPQSTIKDAEIDDIDTGMTHLPQESTDEKVLRPLGESSTARLGISKAKPGTPPKATTDFRSNLRPKPPPEVKKPETPEFLSRVGNLRRATTQNYVAPDVLKDNILRGKSDLTKTSGPVKSERTDEFKDSLLAKKDQWKKEKEDGVVRERKTSAPITPQKPEGLAKREMLGRSETIKPAFSQEKPKTATPEAIARHKSLKERPKTDASLPVLDRQTSAPIQTSQAVSSSTQPPETSKLAARFNPNLAGILARGPPPTKSESGNVTPVGSSFTSTGTRTSVLTTSTNPAPAGAPLEDMRKGRARGPKRRKGTNKEVTSNQDEPSSPTADPLVNIGSSVQAEAILEPGLSTIAQPTATTKSRAPPPGSTASVIMQSLKGQSDSGTLPLDPKKPITPFKSPGASVLKSRESPSVVPAENTGFSTVGKPAPPVQKADLPSHSSVLSSQPSAQTPSVNNIDVAEFTGFGSSQRPASMVRQEENKENSNMNFPAVKYAASRWGQQSPAVKSQVPSRIQLPSKQDEEAAMRSAGLLASSPPRPSTKEGLGIALGKSNGTTGNATGISPGPTKPAKSSRTVSGQLQGVSANKSSFGSPLPSHKDIESQLTSVFGFLPSSNLPLVIDTNAVLSSCPHQERVFKTIRKTVHLVSADETVKQLPEPEEYTFFEESVQICTHTYTVANGPKKTEIFLWAGRSCSESAVDQAQNIAKKQAREAGNAFVHTVRQGLEPPGFLQALGGILITRRGSRTAATKQYILCGRKHLGQIVFDEVDYGVKSLCHGFVYLISYPITLQESKLYLWKGSCCSTDEISAGRLAAMDLSVTGDVIEVDGGAEFASFLKIFGQGTTKADIPSCSKFWERKALAANTFATRLLRVQPEEAKSGIFSSIFTRRPSWNNLSPARRQPEEELKLEVKELSPFTQSDLEADNIYLLDAYNELYVLVGPVFAKSQSEKVRGTMFAQTVRFTAEYAVLAASAETRPTVPDCSVLLSGSPTDVTMLFRHWNNLNGLWGTSSLMAGLTSSPRNDKEVNALSLDDVLDVVCRSE